ncbi:hypothetical protein [Methylocapsa acidiphila]|uniref:hypothetical protein n=1 Tax=Methylocapsa acidiphila TaxID=133552 RepID=UPI0003FADDCB|nr:hypothetical protein [Methylocapsa acidiphila]
MLQRFVVVQALGGKPLKRIVMTSDSKGILVADPGLLGEIETGIHQPVTAPLRTVFNFDEPVFAELMSQWHADKKTDAATWAKLDRFQPMLDAAE